MIYEVRTYTLRPGTVAEFEERYAKRLPLREKHSKLGGFWHTEFGPLNQVVHVYPYDDLRHRSTVRAAMAQDAARNALPGGGDLIVAQEAEIMNPAPFMRALGSRDYGTGNVYEMRTYTYAPGDIPKVLEAWGKAIEAREKFSPWRPAGRASSVGSTSSFTPGCIRIWASAPRSVRNPGGRVAHGRHRPGCGRSGRKTSC
jgi:NIPSNAP